MATSPPQTIKGRVDDAYIRTEVLGKLTGTTTIEQRLPLLDKFEDSGLKGRQFALPISKQGDGAGLKVNWGALLRAAAVGVKIYLG